MNVVAVLMMVMAAGLVYIYLGPVICMLEPGNMKFFKLAGSVLLTWVVICLFTGVARFRSQTFNKVDEPFEYWFSQTSLTLLAAFALYPVYFC
jgi:hypothetical protein